METKLTFADPHEAGDGVVFSTQKLQELKALSMMLRAFFQKERMLLLTHALKTCHEYA